MKVIEDDKTKTQITFVEVEDTGSVLVIKKKSLESAVRELKHWQDNPSASNFTSQLYNIMCKADSDNKKKILKGFPARMVAYLLWLDAPDKDEFYKKYSNLTELDIPELDFENIDPETLSY